MDFHEICYGSFDKMCYEVPILTDTSHEDPDTFCTHVDQNSPNIHCSEKRIEQKL
jgi:hypothetical protein